jgi:hypothetical protein
MEFLRAIGGPTIDEVLKQHAALIDQQSHAIEQLHATVRAQDREIRVLRIEAAADRQMQHVEFGIAVVLVVAVGIVTSGLLALLERRIKRLPVAS